MSIRLGLAIPLALLAAGLAGASDDTPQDAKDKPSRIPRVRFGGFSVSAGYSYFSGPRHYGAYPGYGYGYGYGPWAFYDPFLYGMYFHPGFFNGFGYGPSMGEIKLKSADNNAWVYLDGALAGKADKLKTMWLAPGAYDLEIRAADKRFSQKVYVLSGKTLRLTADMARSEVRP